MPRTASNPSGRTMWTDELPIVPKNTIIQIQAVKELNHSHNGHLVQQITGSGSPVTRTYIKVFAALKLIGQLQRLPAFIKAGISDQELPLANDFDQPGRAHLCMQSKKPLPSGFFDWDHGSLFETYQHVVVIPFFGKQDQPYDFSWAKVFPYSIINQSDELVGAYGSVSKIQIHPLCHSFDERDVFALKQLHDNSDLDSFQREVEMLRRFNNPAHPHVVKLLASFRRDNGHFLIFPWASHDLWMYWKEFQPEPDPGNAELVQWICYQARMLVEAISRIHDIPLDSGAAEHEYGRHGDLKPENILWYESQEGFGRLVIADLGLSKAHRFQSKSYSIRKPVRVTPRYRPPEAVYSGGRMGPVFDVWALGCMFLEMLSWLNGGYRQLEVLEDKITTPSLNGTDTDEYYEWVHVLDGNFYSIRVKKAATEWIHTLRENCSQFVYDFLNIIEDHMLVAERDDRMSAEELVKKIKDLDGKCKETNYCVRKERHERRSGPKPRLPPRGFRKGINVQSEGKNIREVASVNST
ncbi:kinase-like domain-containing protein [Nemania abortiva]|nr:kinase-like domain-containing protein [Nemania abortiva]